MNDEVMERIKAYAERTGKEEMKAAQEFARWLLDEFGVSEWESEDPYLLTEWAEMFVIDTRNLGRSGSGGNRDTIQFVGQILGLNDAPTDLRRRQREEAVSLFKRDSNRAIEQGMIGILKAKEGVWHVNGEPTNERVDGDNLPWFALEVDNTMVALLNNREGTATFGKPIAPTSEVRYMHFLGNEVNSLIENPRLWRIALSGNSMSAHTRLVNCAKSKSFLRMTRHETQCTPTVTSVTQSHTSRTTAVCRTSQMQHAFGSAISTTPTSTWLNSLKRTTTERLPTTMASFRRQLSRRDMSADSTKRRTTTNTTERDATSV